MCPLAFCHPFPLTAIIPLIPLKSDVLGLRTVLSGAPKNLSRYSISRQSQFAGIVQGVDEQGWATVEVKNRFGVGDKIEIIHPDGNQVVTLAELQNHEGMPIQVAPGNGIQVRIPNMHGKEKAVLARLLLNKELM